MKIEIKDDLFGIEKRLKEIDDGYFVLYNVLKNCFEIHNKYQKNTYCLTLPYGELDSRCIDYVNSTSVDVFDNIIEDIDKNNQSVEMVNKNNVRDYGEYVFREIYDFSNNSSKNIDENFLNNVWR